MAQTRVDPFPAAALPDNKSGRLTDDQRRGFGNLERGARKDRIVFAGICAVLAVLILTASGPAPNAWLRPFASAGFAAAAVTLFLYGTFYRDSLTRDLGGGRVVSVEGAIGKHSRSTDSGSSSMTSYYLDVAGHSYEVGGLTYEAAPDAGYVRLYMLPRSHKVVNLERLPDPPLPQGALDSPAQMVGMFAAALRSHDIEQINAARAQGAALEHALEARMAAAAVPPPAGARDPRPLAEAIIGSWQGPFVSMTFTPDGNMVATLPGGRLERGRWSVGPDGKLHSNATGKDEAADAWVAGDTLTVSDEGHGLTFHRA
jgi:hypothetical protein